MPSVSFSKCDIRPDESDIPGGFIRTNERRPDHVNCDVVLLLNRASRERIRCGRDIRRALRNGLSVEINASKNTTRDHMHIFKGFLQTHASIDNEDLDYFNCWREVLKDNDSVLFEVKRHGCLTGFTVLSCFGARTATYAYGFFNNSAAGTSDLAHGAMISYCHRAGYEELDLGYSIHANLLRYKTKWGDTRLVDPPWSIYWTWRGSALDRLGHARSHSSCQRDALGSTRALFEKPCSRRKTHADSALPLLEFGS